MEGQQRRSVVECELAGQLSPGNIFICVAADVRSGAHAFAVCMVKVQVMIQKGATPSIMNPTVSITW